VLSEWNIVLEVACANAIGFSRKMLIVLARAMPRGLEASPVEMSVRQRMFYSLVTPWLLLRRGVVSITIETRSVIDRRLPRSRPSDVRFGERDALIDTRRVRWCSRRYWRDRLNHRQTPFACSSFKMVSVYRDRKKLRDN
jgi:hypothetical protein